MKINTVNEQKQETLSCQNRISLSDIGLKKDFRNFISNDSKADEYISSRSVNKALSSDIYSRLNFGTAFNAKMPISKYSHNGVLTLTENKLLFTPYKESDKGWSKSIFTQKEYEMILGKMEEDNPLKMEEENFWGKRIEADLIPGKNQGGGTDSNIVVNADGSRSLVITMKIGGAETSMCIEISKPTKFQNSKGNASIEQNSRNTDLNESTVHPCLAQSDVRK